MALDLMDKIYIDDAISKALSRQFKDDIKPFFEQLSKEYKDHMTALREGFKDDIRGLSELIQDRPTRNEVREMIKEETDPIKLRLTHIESHLGI